MRKAIHLSAILFTLLTVLFLLLSGALQDLSQTDTVFSNLAVGCGIKAAGLWAGFLSRRENLPDIASVCLRVSIAAAFLLLLILVIDGGIMAFFLTLTAGAAAGAVFLLDLIVWIISKVIERKRQ